VPTPSSRSQNRVSTLSSSAPKRATVIMGPGGCSRHAAAGAPGHAVE
jgi:hypothetical protein